MTETPHPTRIAIIGCGYLGTALGRALRGGNCHTVGTTTSPQRIPEIEDAGIDARVWKAPDVEGLAALLVDREVVYLTVAAGRRDADYRGVYLAAARALMRALPESPVRRVIYTSSTGVYGQEDGAWVDESSPTEPATENGRVLVETERCILDGAREAMSESAVMASVVRLGGIHGPGREFSGRAAHFAGTERDDGDVHVNRIHVEDAVAALVRLLEVNHHGVLNLVDGEPTTRRVLFDRAVEAIGGEPIRWVTPVPGQAKGKRVRNDLIRGLLAMEFHGGVADSR